MSEESTLGEELRALVQEAEALLRSGLSAEGAELKEQAQARLHEMRTHLSALEEHFGAQAREVDRYVRTNPWPALAIAGGAALLLGLLMARRR